MDTTPDATVGVLESVGAVYGVGVGVDGGGGDPSTTCGASGCAIEPNICRAYLRILMLDAPMVRFDLWARASGVGGSTT
jgi:hypothetical protein